jgi:hypothetical protein
MPPEAEDPDDDADFDAWQARLAASRARRLAVEASVESRRAELKAIRLAKREAESARPRPMRKFLETRLKAKEDG